MEMVQSKISNHAWPCQLRMVQRFSYTLVLDLDETLVHFDVRRRIFKVRPLCIRFLEELSLIYEIVIFTAAHESYANFILDKLDP
jgi:CTD small phosphatase-like protein 2